MSDIVKHLRASDPSVNAMAADLIEGRRADSETLRATIADLVKALETARRQLVTLGGDARWDAYGDKIHSTVLHRIDIALAKVKQP
jgi:hypothetical protein